MTETETLFLKAFKASLEYSPAERAKNLENERWGRLSDVQLGQLFELAQSHHVLPMVYDALSLCPGMQPGAGGAASQAKRISLQLLGLQVKKTGDFLDVYEALRKAGARPLVVKGLVLRHLYPKPDLRFSSDEDILVRPEEFDLCDKVLKEQGMVCKSQQEAEGSYEVPYTRPDGVLYIELHKTLFPPEQEAYGSFNTFFEGVHRRAAEIETDGSAVLTLSPEDHLFYLICHALKHFLHSGFGIRQAADIALFANAYGKGIDWQRIMENCRQINAYFFAAAIFKIGKEYLTFDPEKAAFPEEWAAADVDEKALLEDILAAGVYGASTMSRRHSSTITLNAAARKKQTGRTVALLKSLFPPAADLKGRYPCLEKHPALLPAVWVRRAAAYAKETNAAKKSREKKENSPAEAVEIGTGRVELLKQYRIIE